MINYKKKYLKYKLKYTKFKQQGGMSDAIIKRIKRDIVKLKEIHSIQYTETITGTETDTKFILNIEKLNDKNVNIVIKYSKDYPFINPEISKDNIIVLNERSNIWKVTYTLTDIIEQLMNHFYDENHNFDNSCLFCNQELQYGSRQMLRELDFNSLKYMISCHSEHLNDFFILPKNVYIHYSAKGGSLAYGKSLKLNTIHNYSSKYTNFEEIIEDKFKDVEYSIYKPGSIIRDSYIDFNLIFEKGYAYSGIIDMQEYDVNEEVDYPNINFELMKIISIDSIYDDILLELIDITEEQLRTDLNLTDDEIFESFSTETPNLLNFKNYLDSLELETFYDSVMERFEELRINFEKFLQRLNDNGTINRILDNNNTKFYEKWSSAKKKVYDVITKYNNNEIFNIKENINFKMKELVYLIKNYVNDPDRNIIIYFNGCRGCSIINLDKDCRENIKNDKINKLERVFTLSSSNTNLNLIDDSKKLLKGNFFRGFQQLETNIKKLNPEIRPLIEKFDIHKFNRLINYHDQNRETESFDENELCDFYKILRLIQSLSTYK